MADFYVRYSVRGKGCGWGSGAENFTIQNENPSASELINLLREKGCRNADEIRISSVEKRGCKKVEFTVYFSYIDNYNKEFRTNRGVSWYNDTPSMSDIEALLLGSTTSYQSVSITEVKKR